jgi:hypothetical protein
MLKKISVTAICLAALIAVGYIVIVNFGKPISTDLAVIGQGKPTLVLAYENYSPAGGDALNRLRQVSSDYNSRLHFVVADMGTPQGLAFTNRYRLIDGKAIFLASDGQPIQVTDIPPSEGDLRSLLEAKLAAMKR